MEAVPVDDPAFEAAKRQAEEFAAIFGGLQVVTEAELATRGIWPVSVMHGDAETAEDADLIYGGLHRLAGSAAPGRIPGRQRLHHVPVHRPRRQGQRRGVHRPGAGNGPPPVVAHHRHGTPRLALRKETPGHEHRRRAAGT